MTKPVTALKTVVIPAAGKGTRMLPATQVTAKELLPVYDRPVLQFAIDEAIDAGAERIIVVVSDAKPAIRQFLGSRTGRSTGTATRLDRPAPSVEIVYVTQEQPLGLGHAVLCCKGLTLPGPFGVILPDDIIMGKSCLSEMMSNYSSGHMIAAMKVSERETSQYGIFNLRGSADDCCISVTGMVEKPPRGQAPSSIAAVGRYILLPMIFDILGRTPKGAGGELQLTDAIAISTLSAPLTAFRFSGTRYDCGNHDGLLAASNARQATVKARQITAHLYSARGSVTLERDGKMLWPDGGGSMSNNARNAF